MADSFDPKKNLTRLNGTEYLEVKHRILWFRSDYPQGDILTDMITRTDSEAVFKCTVTARDINGVTCGSATGYGTETKADFRDFTEKAETKAVGRALAALGFGTEFAMNAPEAPAPPPAFDSRRLNIQTDTVRQLANELGWESAQIADLAMRTIGKLVGAANYGETEQVIAALRDELRKAELEQPA